MPFGLGFFATAGAGAAAGAYELIQTQLISSDTATVTFSSIPQGFKHLQLRGAIRTNRGFGNDNVGVRLNGDTGSNYAFHVLRGTGSSVVASAVASIDRMRIQSVTGGTAETGNFGPVVLDLLDYSVTTKNKTIRNVAGINTSSGPYTETALTSGLWMNTAAVTSLTLYSETSSSFVSGSRFSIYGLRG